MRACVRAYAYIYGDPAQYRGIFVKRLKGLSKGVKLQILYFLVFHDKIVLLFDISLLLFDKKYMKFDIFFICRGPFVGVPLQ